MAHALRPTPQHPVESMVAPDEAQHFAGYAHQFAESCRHASRKNTAPGGAAPQATHRRLGRLDVLGDMPAFAAQGLFARRRNYDDVRLSNGGMDKAAGTTNLTSGLLRSGAGCAGRPALGNRPAKARTFCSSTRKVCFSPKRRVCGFCSRCVPWRRCVDQFLVQRHGLLGRPADRQDGQDLRAAFGGFASHAMFSRAHCVGPMPCGCGWCPMRPTAPVRQVQHDWDAEFSAACASKTCSGPCSTCSRPWTRPPPRLRMPAWTGPSPYTTVGPAQPARQDPAADAALAAEGKPLCSTPGRRWLHRPWRRDAARKVVYFEPRQVVALRDLRGGDRALRGEAPNGRKTPDGAKSKKGGF